MLTIDNMYGYIADIDVADKQTAVKEIFGQYTPYDTGVDIAGNITIKLGEHFLFCVKEAMSDGCVARMGKSELRFWLDFVAYQNDIQDGTRDDIDLSIATEREKELELAYAALSQWIVDELAGVDHINIDCYITDYKVV